MGLFSYLACLVLGNLYFGGTDLVFLGFTEGTNQVEYLGFFSAFNAKFKHNFILLDSKLSRFRDIKASVYEE